MNCRYRYCGDELPWGINGNKRYCDDDCSNAERLEREKDKYATRKATLSEFKRVETLLRACYQEFGESPFDINILRGMKMNWTILSDTQVIDDMSYRIVGTYGYVAFDNNIIKIVKI
jgi:hypothetical protein